VHRVGAILTGSVLLLAVVGCTAEGEPPRAGGAPSSPATTARPTPSASPSATASPRPVNPVSVPALFDRPYDGRGLRLGPALARTDVYTSYTVTYRSGPLRISGKLDVPRGRGPHPAVVLAHGYIDPAIYSNGQGMRREQDWLARAGYVVLHVDYRNHAGSSKDPSAERRLRLGYTVDVVNAVKALRRTTDVAVDDDRIGLVGRSMGGGVVYNVLVAQPGLVDAAVVFAPVSSRTADNFDRWIRDDPGRRVLADRIARDHGLPEDSPRFWREVSPRPYFDRITEPVLIHHGTADESCPIRWSRATFRAMKAAGVDARMYTYPGEPHAFVADWPLAMRRTTAFLRANLKT
jgi:dipeptidyl aminopeptidase/acylaminoacyl peptidase